MVASMPSRLVVVATAIMLVPQSLAHGPIFSPAPETIWQGGREVTLGYRRGEAGSEVEQEMVFEAEYGLTARWEIGMELPRVSGDGSHTDGLGNLALATKYQFWRRDLPGAQYKAAGFVRLTLPTATDDALGGPRGGSTDVTTGLATGYEGRRWYWFASGTWRFNADSDSGVDRGDRRSLNLVGGIRPVLTEYDEPDTVLMLEMNWEGAGRDERGSRALADTGGWQLFVSPGIWWTWRQFAVRGGLRMPVRERLNGDKPDSDWQAKLEFVYHF